MGDPFISFRYYESKCEQIIKDKDALISKRKSELLVWYSEFGKAKHMGKG